VKPGFAPYLETKFKGLEWKLNTSHSRRFSAFLCERRQKNRGRRSEPHAAADEATQASEENGPGEEA
jgi:hypothetical protein